METCPPLGSPGWHPGARGKQHCSYHRGWGWPPICLLGPVAIGVQSPNVFWDSPGLMKPLAVQSTLLFLETVPFSGVRGVYVSFLWNSWTLPSRLLPPGIRKKRRNIMSPNYTTPYKINCMPILQRPKSQRSGASQRVKLGFDPSSLWF